jgi:hypothetical protein
MMENRFDELAKALAGGMSRRDALRRLGGGLVGAVLASLGLGKAWGQAPFAGCVKFCRDTCGISPGNGGAFSQCVSSCENCWNTAGTICACPVPGTKKVVCCHSPEVCLNGLCGNVQGCSSATDCPNFLPCGGGGDCTCVADIHGAPVCVHGLSPFCAPCSDCPPGSVCVVVPNCCSPGLTGCARPC